MTRKPRDFVRRAKIGGLVLTQKQGDIFTLDKRILVEIVQIRGRCVRVAIKAPEKIEIKRGDKRADDARNQANKG